MTRTNATPQLVITEFPKSGGSWITSLLGGALGRPKRDIYVTDQFDTFDISRHPWYRASKDRSIGSEAVVKSHELPDSPLFDASARFIHLIRDGRDVVVSKWFFDTEFCTKNQLSAPLSIDFETYAAETGAEWAAFVRAWRNTGVLTIRYEDFLNDPLTELTALIEKLGEPIPATDVLEKVIKENSKEAFAAALVGLFQHNTFVRKGVAGDWRRHFTPATEVAFAEATGNLLAELGYDV